MSDSSVWSIIKGVSHCELKEFTLRNKALWCVSHGCCSPAGFTGRLEIWFTRKIRQVARMSTMVYWEGRADSDVFSAGKVTFSWSWVSHSSLGIKLLRCKPDNVCIHLLVYENGKPLNTHMCAVYISSPPPAHWQTVRKADKDPRDLILVLYENLNVISEPFTSFV